MEQELKAKIEKRLAELREDQRKFQEEANRTMFGYSVAIGELEGLLKEDEKEPEQVE